MEKKGKVILLPTENKSNIRKEIGSQGELFYNETFKRGVEGYYPFQHLYITSDDEIKEGDWCTDGVEVIQASSKLVEAQSLHNRREWRKIIATTDSSLGLPQPSEGFIKKFVKAYNKGNVIEEVNVEYIECHQEPSLCMNLCNCGLKINPKDNTITIKKIKDSWSREEVIALCQSAYYRGSVSNQMTTEKFGANPKYSFDKWIEENL